MMQRSKEVTTEAVAIVPNWELLVYTPGVFVRVASKRLAGYGTWKSVRKMEDGQSGDGAQGEKALRLNGVAPVFLVSVASTGVRFTVSLLFAALARESASVASKGFTDVDCWQEGNWRGWVGADGVRRTARREGMKAGARKISAGSTKPL
jgi:hypothetical protein